MTQLKIRNIVAWLSSFVVGSVIAYILYDIFWVTGNIGITYINRIFLDLTMNKGYYMNYDWTRLETINTLLYNSVFLTGYIIIAISIAVILRYLWGRIGFAEELYEESRNRALTVLFLALVFIIIIPSMMVGLTVMVAGSTEKKDLLAKAEEFNDPMEGLIFVSQQILKKQETGEYLYLTRTANFLFFDELLSKKDPDFYELFMKPLGIDRADIILWQRAGSSFQYAYIAKYFAEKLGMETRLAKLLGPNHYFVEVKYYGNWYVFDYVLSNNVNGNIIPIKAENYYVFLKTKKPELLEEIKGIQIFDGKQWVDATELHGFIKPISQG